VYSIYWLLQLVIPTILISHAAQRIASSPQQCRAHSNKHFKTVFLRFRTPVVPATVIPWYSSFSWLFPKIRRNWRLFIASFASLLSLQYTFVASQCLRFRYFRKFVGFDVIYLTVRFVSCFLCCCRVSLQPQFHIFAGIDVIKLTVRFVSCFLCCCRVSLQPQCTPRFPQPFAVFRVSCVVVEFHSSHSSLLIFVYFTKIRHRFRQL
jgi:hypothetical protein